MLASTGAALASRLRTGATARVRFLGAAAGAFLVPAAAWPIALYLRSPELAQSWWYGAAHARGEFGANLGYYLATAAWFAWPAWPLALWSAWTLRAEWRSPRVFVPLSAALLALVAIAWAGPQQDINTVAAARAARSARRARRGAAAARRGKLLDWFGVMTSVLRRADLAGLRRHDDRLPPKIANNFAKSAPGFLPSSSRCRSAPRLRSRCLALPRFCTAPSPTCGVTRWAAGVALLWGSFATLLLPWADYVKSYRSVALQLKSTLPAGAGCIAERELAAPQRAALSFHAGILTEPQQASAAPPKCRYLIVQGKPREEIAPGAGWHKLADVGRPGDKGERYRLYRYGPG